MAGVDGRLLPDALGVPGAERGAFAVGLPDGGGEVHHARCQGAVAQAEGVPQLVDALDQGPAQEERLVRRPAVAGSALERRGNL